MENQVKQAAMSEVQIQQTLKGIAESVGYPMRSPILETPADYDLEFENVSFPALDGVSLEAWFIPCKGSGKLIIANHPMGFNRYGLPSHLEPWKSLFASTGNDFEVKLIPDYKILHDTGYNVLTYDLRNFGHSNIGNGLGSAGIVNARDVIGSLMYAKTRKELSEMTVGLFSRCLGCNSTMFAMQQYPEYFEGVRCLVGAQPLSVRATLERDLERLGIPEHIEDMDHQIRLITSFRLDDLSPIEAAKSIHIPTFLYQVHDDLMTTPRDVQAMFDNIPGDEKKLYWIQGTTRRWDGYAYFGKYPEQMLDWFEAYMN